MVTKTCPWDMEHVIRIRKFPSFKPSKKDLYQFLNNSSSMKDK